MLLPTDCFLDNSSAAWIGLQNIWPLFLTIFCFIAVRWVHSFTNLRIWQRTQQSAAGQALHRAFDSGTVPWISALSTGWKQFLQSEMVPSGNSSHPHPRLWNPLSSCFIQQLVESARNPQYKFKFQPCWRTYKKNQFYSYMMVFCLENQIIFPIQFKS